ncbi:MAG: hypothetical protein M1817_001065 [Caeruleum heppii]|nr:MAG: hypothetical protein M1817_001065 [Caeruleum heppii]
MLFSKVLIVLCPLLATEVLSAFNNGLYDAPDVGNLRIATPASSSNASNSSISFTLFDEFTNSTGYCNGTFSTAAPSTFSYQRCAVATTNESYGFRFEEGRFKNIGDFTLELKHGFHDPRVGTPDYVTVYSQANITAGLNSGFQCANSTNGTGASCQAINGTVFPTRISGLVAK